MTAATPAHGASLTDAIALYQQILAEHPKARHAVRGYGGAKLVDFCEPTGWLGLWMLKSEVHSMTLFGCRLWDVAYQASETAAEGILPIDRSDIHLSDAVESSYSRVKVADTTNMTAALRFLIAQHGLNESILENNQLIESKPLSLPGYDQSLSVGDVLAFPDEAACIGVLLADFSTRTHRELAKIRAQRTRDNDPGLAA